MEQDMQLMKLLQRCGHVIYHRRCLNQSQNQILLLLKKHGAMNQKALMEHMHIRSGSMSEVIAKVEHAGYITKSRSQDDRRNYDVVLTEAGKKQAEHFEKHQEEMAKRLFDSLTQTQKDQLQNILESLIEQWADLKSCRQCERGNKIC